MRFYMLLENPAKDKHDFLTDYFLTKIEKITNIGLHDKKTSS